LWTLGAFGDASVGSSIGASVVSSFETVDKLDFRGGIVEDMRSWGSPAW
jgi:hypothetical protein